MSGGTRQYGGRDIRRVDAYNVDSGVRTRLKAQRVGQSLRTAVTLNNHEILLIGVNGGDSYNSGDWPLSFGKYSIHGSGLLRAFQCRTPYHLVYCATSSKDYHDANTANEQDRLSGKRLFDYS